MRFLWDFICDGLNPERREAERKAEALAEVLRQRREAFARADLAKQSGCTQDLHHARATVRRLTTEALKLELAR